VHLLDGSRVTGRVYTVDPITASVVLIEFDGAKNPTMLQVLPGDSIKSISELEMTNEAEASTSEALNAWMGGLFGGSTEVGGGQADAQALERRREALSAWFTRNHIPVTSNANGSLSIFDAVRIVTPYTAEQCYCDNALVLNKVRKLVEAMPTDEAR